MPAEDVIARLASEAQLSPAQVQRWLSRRMLSLSVMQPAPASSSRPGLMRDGGDVADVEQQARVSAAFAWLRGPRVSLHHLVSPELCTC